MKRLRLFATTAAMLALAGPALALTGDWTCIGPKARAGVLQALTQPNIHRTLIFELDTAGRSVTVPP